MAEAVANAAALPVIDILRPQIDGDLDAKLAISRANAKPGKATEFFKFPILRKDIRARIWKHAIPRYKELGVEVRVDGCENARPHGCQKKEKNGEDEDVPLKTFTFTLGKDWKFETCSFGVLECCKEARAIGVELLPNVLATRFPEPGIRFHPDTPIYIKNLGDIFRTMSELPNEHEEEAKVWFCPQSYRGQGIQKLVVLSRDLIHPERHFDNNIGSRSWDGSLWVWMLRFLFKDSKVVFVQVPPTDPGYLFDAEDYDEEEDCHEENHGKENNGEENDGEVEAAQPEDYQTAQTSAGNADQGSAGGELRHFRPGNFPDMMVDVDRVEAWMGQLWDNIIDELDGLNCFKDGRRIRTDIVFVEGILGVKGAKLVELPRTDPKDRVEFHRLVDGFGWGGGYN